MGRSKWKFKFFCKQIYRVLIKLKKKNKLIDEYRRRYFLKKICSKYYYNKSMVLPKIFSGFSIKVKKYSPYFKLRCKFSRVGFKSGDFILNRKPFYYPQKERKKKR